MDRLGDVGVAVLRGDLLKWLLELVDGEGRPGGDLVAGAFDDRFAAVVQDFRRPLVAGFVTTGEAEVFEFAATLITFGGRDEFEAFKGFDVVGVVLVSLGDDWL